MPENVAPTKITPRVGDKIFFDGSERLFFGRILGFHDRDWFVNLELTGRGVITHVLGDGKGFWVETQTTLKEKAQIVMRVEEYWELDIKGMPMTQYLISRLEYLVEIPKMDIPGKWADGFKGPALAWFSKLGILELNKVLNDLNVRFKTYKKP